MAFSCKKEERTPYTITKALFGIDIKKETKVIEFRDEWGGSITGDGETLIVFKIDQS